MRLKHFLLLALPLLFAGCAQSPIQDSKHFCNSSSDCAVSGSDPDGFGTCVNRQWGEEWGKNPDSNSSRWACILTGNEKCGCIENKCKRLDNESCGTGKYPDKKGQCEAQGGSWGRFGLADYNSCNLPTKDAGKECSDSADCEAQLCIAELTAEQRDNLAPGFAMTGICPNWTINAGCMDTVVNGKYGGTLCID